MKFILLFKKHWLHLQNDGLSAMRLLHESPYFLLLITTRAKIIICSLETLSWLLCSFSLLAFSIFCWWYWVLWTLIMQVTLWTGDALSLCTSGFPPEQLFDVIDTSNVGDHIGLLNVLVCCGPRLKMWVALSRFVIFISFIWLPDWHLTYTFRGIINNYPMKSLKPAQLLSSLEATYRLLLSLCYYTRRTCESVRA